MVVALFGLSLVMIVGGVAAVVQGFPYVRLESGLAMVIAGATASSAGVILLGLSAVVLHLRRLEQVFRQGRDTDHVTAARSEVSAPVVPVPPAVSPFAGLTVDPPGARTEPRVDLREPEFPSPTIEARRAEPANSEVRTPEAGPAPFELPNPIGRDAARRSTDAESERRAESAAPASLTEDDLFTPIKPAPRSDGVEPVVKPETPVAHAAAQEPEQPSGIDAEKAPQERTVVGTYASGGNTYVMFADGSIEAETPRGRFTFGSLTELKAFVEAGGESGDARGAA